MEPKRGARVNTSKEGGEDVFLPFSDRRTTPEGDVMKRRRIWRISGVTLEMQRRFFTTIPYSSSRSTDGEEMGWLSETETETEKKPGEKKPT